MGHRTHNPVMAEWIQGAGCALRQSQREALWQGSPGNKARVQGGIRPNLYVWPRTAIPVSELVIPNPCVAPTCGVMSTSGSAMRPLWLASMTLLRGMTVLTSFTWGHRGARRVGMGAGGCVPPVALSYA